MLCVCAHNGKAVAQGNRSNHDVFDSDGFARRVKVSKYFSCFESLFIGKWHDLQFCEDELLNFAPEGFTISYSQRAISQFHKANASRAQGRGGHSYKPVLKTFTGPFLCKLADDVRVKQEHGLGLVRIEDSRHMLAALRDDLSNCIKERIVGI
jgi:hypothetical protein